MADSNQQKPTQQDGGCAAVFARALVGSVKVALRATWGTLKVAWRAMNSAVNEILAAVFKTEARRFGSAGGIMVVLSVVLFCTCCTALAVGSQLDFGEKATAVPTEIVPVETATPTKEVTEAPEGSSGGRFTATGAPTEEDAAEPGD